jgi:hypothetical protein
MNKDNPIATPVRYELNAHIWKRESTQEWVLEISGEINGTNFICRHSQPLTLAVEDVAGLDELYREHESLKAENARLKRKLDVLLKAANDIEAVIARGGIPLDERERLWEAIAKAEEIDAE